MDRLKVKYIDNSVSVKKDLHSSMDRLKEDCIVIPSDSLYLFTFQYG